MIKFLLLAVAALIVGATISSCLPDDHPLTAADVACIQRDACQ